MASPFRSSPGLAGCRSLTSPASRYLTAILLNTGNGSRQVFQNFRSKIEAGLVGDISQTPNKTPPNRVGNSIRFFISLIEFMSSAATYGLAEIKGRFAILYSSADLFSLNSINSFFIWNQSINYI